MKYLAVLIAAFMLTACVVEEGSDQTNEFKVICIDNVEYWLHSAGYGSLLAPRVNPDTMTFVRCQSE